jgi:hypothetical protein
MGWPVRLLLVLLLIAGPAAATPSGSVHEVAEKGTPVELGAIGVVTGGKGITRATGFLVSDCEVLTVKHAAGRVRGAIGRRMRFTQAGEGGLTSDGTVIAEGNLDLVRAWGSPERRGDWLLLRLDQCIGRAIGHVTLSPMPFSRSGYWAPGTPDLESAGFPVGRRWRDGITRDPRCRIRASRRGMHLNDCAARSGFSGSPLFVRDGSGAPLMVFAMQSAAPIAGLPAPWRLGQSNLAIALDDIWPQVAPHLTKPITGTSPRRAR